MSKIEVNTVDVQCGSTLTLGSSGKTVTLASGASPHPKESMTIKMHLFIFLLYSYYGNLQL